MNSLEQRILKDGIVLDSDILKVDSFLNHQVDVKLLKAMGSEFLELFSDKKDEINKILTIEASGIAIAAFVAEAFNVPMVFAKKGEHKNVGNDVYTADVYSFTKGRTYEIAVSKKYINKVDKILVIDDFLANGQAVLGLKSLIEQGGAEMVGAGIAIEKAFQPGRQKLKEAGIDLRALAVIESMSPETGVKFGTN